MPHADVPQVDAADLAMRWVQEIFNDRNLSAADDLVADTYIEHAVAPFGTEEPGPMGGPEGMRRTAAWLTDQSPDRPGPEAGSEATRFE